MSLKRLFVPSLRRPAPLLPLPERTERTIFAHGKILAFLVWTTHVAVADHDRLDTVASEEVFDFLLHFRILLDSGADPSFDDGLGSLSNDDARSDLRRNLVVGAVERDRADGKLRLG